MSSRDTGLQKERTQLAWGRSSLGLVTLVLMLVKLGALSAFQLLLVLVALRLILGDIAWRRDELSHAKTIVSSRTVLRHLWISLSVILASVWLLIQR